LIDNGCEVSPSASSGPAVDQNDDVVDVESGENIAGAAPKPRGKLGR
jgi:hypothetical protein